MKKQQFDKSFKAEINGSDWTFIPTGEMPDCYGITNFDDNTIMLEAIAEERDFLDVTIHESLHAAFPWMREFLVDQIGSDVANVVWKMGYRKAENDDAN